MKLRDWYELARIQLNREDGQTMAEYGLLVAFIALVALIGASLLGLSLKDFFTSIANQM